MNDSFFAKYRAFIFLIILSLLVVGGLSYQLMLAKIKSGGGTWIANGVRLDNLSVSSSVTSGKLATATLQLRPAKDMIIRGYEMRVPFDTKKIRITGIRYLLGIVSHGIGDDNARLDKVNSQGYVKIMAEIESPAGQFLSAASSISAVEITAMIKGKPSRFNLIPASTILYQIAEDGGLTPVPVK